MKRHTSLWFHAAAIIGAVIAIWLVVDTLFAYRYVRAKFARDEGLVQAVEEVSSLEHELRRQHIDSVDGVERVLREIGEDRSDEIAWIRVLTPTSRLKLRAGQSSLTRCRGRIGFVLLWNGARDNQSFRIAREGRF